MQHTLIADSSAAAWRPRSNSWTACWDRHRVRHWHVVRLHTKSEVWTEVNSRRSRPLDEFTRRLRCQYTA